MRIEIDIPKEFEEQFKQDKFKDSLERIMVDIWHSLENGNCLCAGRYEYDTIEMLEKALEDSKPTVYDVDKVIEELEEAKHEIYLYDVDLEYYQNRIDKAIEIVKQGSDANVVCEWKKIDEEGYKNCECNYDETIPDFFKYCPYCRKKIKIVGD